FACYNEEKEARVMDLFLKDKTVLITGASKGLGKATALAVAQEDEQEWIARRSGEKLKHAVEDIQKQSGNKNVQYMACDMRDGAAITALVKNVAAKEGGIDVLVNNAGGPPAGGFLEMEDTDWQAAFEQNLLSVVRAS